MSVQKALFEKIKPLIPPNKSMAEYLGNILFLSSDSVYRRLRGETQITLDELKTICEHFGLSADSLIGHSRQGQVLFEVSSMGDHTLSFVEFFTNIRNELAALKHVPGSSLIYSDKDIPFFNHLIFPQLFAFKYHIWMQVFAQSPDFAGKGFNPFIEDANLSALPHEILRMYNDIPSVEIWNSEFLNGLLFQINFYKHSRYFSSMAQIAALYDEVDELLLHMEKQAEAGCKFLPGENPELRPANYKLFLNQVSLSDNIILAKAGDRSKIFINYSVLNFLTTHDHAFCVETEDYLQNLIRRSSQISVENIKLRSIFFNEQHEYVNHFRKKLL